MRHIQVTLSLCERCGLQTESARAAVCSGMLPAPESPIQSAMSRRDDCRRHGDTSLGCTSRPTHSSVTR